MWGIINTKSKTESHALDILLAGSLNCICGRYLSSLEEVDRQQIYTYYEFERLENKYNDIMDFYHNHAGSNWNQTLFYYLFRYLGDSKNKAAYMALAKRVSYNAILKERHNPLRVEALLLGASGLLKAYEEDSYTLALKKEAEYLMRKYNIKPLSSKDWRLDRTYPHNGPVLRLAQAAALFSQNELLFDKVIGCRCLEDIEDIFMVEASDYWTSHYIPVKESRSEIKRLGSAKCNILGINLVVMLQYAYGSYIASDELIDQAQNLIQDLKLEHNKFTKPWIKHGVRPQTAFEGQALLQIAEKYCSRRLCRECHLGAKAMEDMSWFDK